MAGYVWKGKPEAPAPKKPATPRIPTSTCGTHAGYQAHWYYRQEACTPCKEAQAEYHREYRRRAKRGEITPRTQLTDKCGTNAGYMRHIRRGMDACHPCRAAHSKYTSGLKIKQRAERKAATIRRQIVWETHNPAGKIDSDGPNKTAPDVLSTRTPGPDH